MKLPEDFFLKLSYILLLTGFIGLFFLSLTLLFKSDDEKPVTETPKPSTNYIMSNIHEIKVDGCEYIVFDSFKKGGITHKANCKNHQDD